MRLGDLDALKKVIHSSSLSGDREWLLMDLDEIIDNAPAVEMYSFETFRNICCKTCAEKLRPHGEWIPVSEKMPDNETEVLIQYGQSIMIGYHMWDFTVYPSAFADKNETGWYDSKDDFICGSDEVIAWQPLPEPYKEGGTV